MKLTHYIYISAALAMLTACGDDIDPVYTVGEADNAILFSAGVNQETGAATRAAGDGHVALQNGTYVHLRAAGTWTGHTPSDIVQYKPYKVKSGATADAENYKALEGANVPFYWDDYGTADPGNSTNRSAGLTFWAYAIDGKGETSNITGLQAPTPNATAEQITAADNTWKAMSWKLPVDQSTNDWHDYDLLFAKTTGYKFDEQKAGTYAKIDLKHAMSKITVNLRANKGFPISGSVHVFENTPEVKLLGFTIKGTADASTEKMTASNASDAVASEIVTKKASTATDTYNATYEALVMPDRVLKATVTNAQTSTTEAETSSTENIVRLKADDNEYKVTSAQIVKAIVKAGDGTGSLTTENADLTGTLQSGKNYVINIIVNKTEVHVSARIVDWDNITAEDATPKIPFAMNYGDKTQGDVFNKSYSLYYNEKKDYSSDGTTTYAYGSKIGDTDFYQNESAYNSSAFSPENYWPDHNTKYFFRGIYPQTGDGTDTTQPSVATFADAESATHQGIPVSNAVYNSSTEGSFPSSLMLGIPYLENQTATDKTEPTDGIGATEGTITLTFGYCMSQVIVHLMSSGADEPDNIDFGSSGGAEQAVVNIINGYKTGYIRLSDGVFDPGTNNKDLYLMNAVSSTAPAIPTKDQYTALASSWSNTSFSDADYLTRHDVVVPQSLDGMKFQIFTGPNGNKDKYEIDIKSIPVYVTGSSDTTTIDKWEPGKRYIYTLKITKTHIIIEARIKDWIDVYAGGDFWM